MAIAMDLLLNTNYTNFVFGHAPLAIERIFFSFQFFFRISVWMSRAKPVFQIQSLPNSNELLRMLVRMFVLDYCDDKNLQPKA